MGWRAQYLKGFPLPVPARCRGDGNGKREARPNARPLLRRASRSSERPSIGIGGHLTMPPLPHHRAYGSVPRRFGGLSTRELLHGKQSQTTEASFGEAAMQSFREAQPPGSLGAKDGRTGRPFGGLEPTELAIALTARLPLDPG